MKKIIALILCACCLNSPLRAADKNAHVVIISIDGLAGYLLDDPKAPLATIRGLAKSGGFVAGGMHVSNPSVTWPNHTSLVTGVRPEKHGVLANGVLVRGGVNVPVVVDPRRDKTDLVRVATIYDAAKAAGLSTAEVNWPCTRGAKTLDASFPDVPEAVEHTTPAFRKELVAAGLLADETEASFKAAHSNASRDILWTEAACHLIRTQKPNLLLLHLLNVDATHHAEGPRSQPGYTANALADLLVGRVLAALDEAGTRKATTLFIVADHGFALTPNAICPNRLLRQEGLLTFEAGKVTEARINVFPEGGTGLIYCNDPGAVEADRQRVKALFTGREGVAEVLEPSQYHEHGLPHPREYSQAPDLVLVCRPGYAVNADAAGEAWVEPSEKVKSSLGSHGLMARDAQMNAVCVIAGRGILAGSQTAEAENIDVAPTVARLLDLSSFQSDGKPLNALLTP
ncbi:MAG: alkaline phosphatase family protein [Pirellulales bacterium]